MKTKRYIVKGMLYHKKNYSPKYKYFSELVFAKTALGARIKAKKEVADLYDIFIDRGYKIKFAEIEKLGGDKIES